MDPMVQDSSVYGTLCLAAILGYHLRTACSPELCLWNFCVLALRSGGTLTPGGQFMSTERRGRGHLHLQAEERCPSWGAQKSARARLTPGMKRGCHLGESRIVLVLPRDTESPGDVGGFGWCLE